MISPTINREEWLKARRKCITATDAAAILELHPYKTPRDVWREKVGMAEEREETAPVYWGNRLEPVVIEEFAKRHRVEVVPGRFVTSAEFPLLGATPDGFVGEDRLLEVKTANQNAGQNFGRSGSDEVPMQYLIQCQHQMLVTGRDVCWLAVLIAGQDYREYPIKADKDLHRSMASRLVRWWRCVEEEECPPVTGHPSDTESVNEANPYGQPGTILPASDDAEEAAAELAKLDKRLREMTTERDRLTNVLKETMGDFEAMQTTEGRFTWKNQSRKKTDWESLAAKLAEMAGIGPEGLSLHLADHTTETRSRVFRTPFKSDRA